MHEWRGKNGWISFQWRKLLTFLYVQNLLIKMSLRTRSLGFNNNPLKRLHHLDDILWIEKYSSREKKRKIQKIFLSRIFSRKLCNRFFFYIYKWKRRCTTGWKNTTDKLRMLLLDPTLRNRRFPLSRYCICMEQGPREILNFLKSFFFRAFYFVTASF